MVADRVQQAFRLRNVAAGDGETDLLHGRVGTGIAVARRAVVALPRRTVAAARPALLLDLLVGLVDLLHFLLREIGKRVIVIIVGMILPRKVTIGLLYLLVRCGGRDVQYFVGVVHSASSLLFFLRSPYRVRVRRR